MIQKTLQAAASLVCDNPPAKRPPARFLINSCKPPNQPNRTRDNNLEGPLPQDLGWSWKRTTDLDLANNGLTGTLPESWASLDKLEMLDLSHNKLTGTVPPGWSSLLYHAKTVFLAHNQLWGALPAEWGRAAAGSGGFDRFDVRGNRKLEGCVPNGMERFVHSAAPFASIYFQGTAVTALCSNPGGAAKQPDPQEAPALARGGGAARPPAGAPASAPAPNGGGFASLTDASGNALSGNPAPTPAPPPPSSDPVGGGFLRIFGRRMLGLF
jgi:hypothetical protein